MSDLGTYQIAFPDFAISYPEPQFRVDARPLFDDLRTRFLAGMAEVYDRHAEAARRKYNELDPTTERPPIAANGIALIGVAHPTTRRKSGNPRKTRPRMSATNLTKTRAQIERPKKKPAKSAAKRKKR